jgi:hypothetical protein
LRDIEPKGLRDFGQNDNKDNYENQKDQTKMGYG